MQQYLPVLRTSLLFASMDDAEILSALHCLHAKTVSYEKQTCILRRGNFSECLGLLLSGSANILQEDFWGNQNIVSHIQPGQIFAEVFACTSGAPLTVSVLAAESCTVLFLYVRPLLQPGASACGLQSVVTRNLLSDMAAKNLRLSEKISHITQRSTRGKLLS